MPEDSQIGGLSKIFVDLRAYAVKASEVEDKSLSIAIESNVILKDIHSLLSNISIATDNSVAWLQIINKTLADSFGILIRKQVLENDLPSRISQAAAGSIVNQLTNVAKLTTENISKSTENISSSVVDSKTRISELTKTASESSAAMIESISGFASTFTAMRETALQAAQSSTSGTISSGGDITNNVNFASAAIGSSNLNLTTLFALASVPGLGKRLAKVIVDMNSVFMSISLPVGTQEEIQKRAIALNALTSVLNGVQNIKFGSILKSIIILKLLGNSLAKHMGELTKTIMDATINSFDNLENILSTAERKEGSLGSLILSISRAPLQIFEAINTISNTSMKDLLVSTITFGLLSKLIGKNLGLGIRNLYEGIGDIPAEISESLQRIGNIFETFANLPIIRVLFAAALYNKAFAAISDMNFSEPLEKFNKNLPKEAETNQMLDGSSAITSFINELTKIRLVKLFVVSQTLDLALSGLKTIDVKTPLKAFNKQLSSIESMGMLDNIAGFATFIETIVKLPVFGFIFTIETIKTAFERIAILEQTNIEKSLRSFNKQLSVITSSKILDNIAGFATFIETLALLPWIKFTFTTIALLKVSELEKLNIEKPLRSFNKQLGVITRTKILDNIAGFATFIETLANIPWRRFAFSLFMLGNLNSTIKRVKPETIDFTHLENVFKLEPNFKNSVLGFSDVMNAIANIKWGRITLGILSLIPIAASSFVASKIFSRINDDAWNSIVRASQKLVDIFDKLGEASLSGIKKAGAVAFGITATIGLIGLSLKAFSSVKLADIGKAALSVVGLIGIAKFLKENKIDDALKSVATLALLSSSLLPLAISLRLMEGVSLATIGITTAMIAGLIGISKLISKNEKIARSALRGAVTIGAMGLALAPLAISLNIMEGISFKTIAVTGLAIAGLIGISKLISKNEKVVRNSLKGAIVMGAMGLALAPLAISLNLMEGISFKTVSVLAASIGVLGGAAFILGKMAGQIAIGASVLGLLGLAFIPLSIGLKIASGITPSMVGALAGSILVLGLSAAALGVPAVAALVGLGSAVLGIMGLSLIPLSIGLKKLGEVKWDAFPSPLKLLGILSSLALGSIPLGLASPFMFAAGLGILPLSIGLNKLGEVKWDAFPSFTQLTAILTGIALGAVPLGLAAPFMLIGGLGLLPLSFGLLALSKVDWDAFPGFKKIFGVLTAIGLGSLPLRLMKNTLKGGLGMIALAGGLFALSKVDWDALPGFKKVFGALSGIALGSMPLVFAAPGMILGGLAMLPLALGLHAFSSVNWKALENAHDIIANMLVAVKAGGLGLLLAAPGMILGGLGMISLGHGFQAFSKVNWEGLPSDTEIIKTTLQSLIKGTEGLLIAAPGMILGGLGFLALGHGLQAMSKVNWKGFPNKDVVNDTMAALTAGSIRHLLIGAPGMAAGGLAMIPLAEGLQGMSKVNWRGMPNKGVVEDVISGLSGAEDLGDSDVIKGLNMAGLALIPFSRGLMELSKIAWNKFPIDSDYIGDLMESIADEANGLAKKKDALIEGGTGLKFLANGFKALTDSIGDIKLFDSIARVVTRIALASKDFKLEGIKKLAEGIKLVVDALLPLAAIQDSLVALDTLINPKTTMPNTTADAAKAMVNTSSMIPKGEVPMLPPIMYNGKEITSPDDISNPKASVRRKLFEIAKRKRDDAARLEMGNEVFTATKAGISVEELRQSRNNINNVSPILQKGNDLTRMPQAMINAGKEPTTITAAAKIRRRVALALDTLMNPKTTFETAKSQRDQAAKAMVNTSSMIPKGEVPMLPPIMHAGKEITSPDDISNPKASVRRKLFEIAKSQRDNAARREMGDESVQAAKSRISVEELRRIRNNINNVSPILQKGNDLTHMSQAMINASNRNQPRGSDMPIMATNQIIPVRIVNENSVVSSKRFEVEPNTIGAALSEESGKMTGGITIVAPTTINGGSTINAPSTSSSTVASSSGPMIMGSAGGSLDGVGVGGSY